MPKLSTCNFFPLNKNIGWSLSLIHPIENACESHENPDVSFIYKLSMPSIQVSAGGGSQRDTDTHAE